MDVVAEVGDREHECCGEAVERNQFLDLACIRYEGPDGRTRLADSHHGGLGVAAAERVRGRVIDLHVVREDGPAQPILRVPSGRAPRGSGDGDDGHLEDPWTGDVVASESRAFLVTVRTSAEGVAPGL